MPNPHIVRRTGDYSNAANWSDRQKLALACRHLASTGHESGLAGQITCRTETAGHLLAPPMHLIFSEMRASDFITVNDSFDPVDSTNKPNPATRFHLWIYRRRPDVECIIHTHPPHTAALSMLKQPLVVAHMDTTPFYNDCAFLTDWPGVPVADEEGEIISTALGSKRSILLSHHGLLVTGTNIEEAAYLAVAMEHAARLQLLASAAGEIQPVPDELAQEAHEFLLQPAITQMTFESYGRRVLRESPECME